MAAVGILITRDYTDVKLVQIEWDGQVLHEQTFC